MSEDFEELEQIPWAALAATPGDARTRQAAITIGIVAVAAVVAWFTMRGSDPTVTLTETEQPPTPALAQVPIAAADAPLPSPLPPSEPVYSEADLMLINVADEERIAVMQAEWLVRDYLTVDDDPTVAARVADLLPGLEARDPTPAYVEWVRAFSVTSPDPGHYRVEVLYRVLKAEGDGFVRQPAAAVAVDVAIDVDGSARLLASPESVTVPTLNGIEL